MRIKVKVHPNSSQEKFEVVSPYDFEIWVKEKPIDGKVNEKIEKMLKKELKKEVKIISGFKSRKKIVEVD